MAWYNVPVTRKGLGLYEGIVGTPTCVAAAAGTYKPCIHTYKGGRGLAVIIDRLLVSSGRDRGTISEGGGGQPPYRHSMDSQKLRRGLSGT